MSDKAFLIALFVLVTSQVNSGQWIINDEDDIDYKGGLAQLDVDGAPSDEVCTKNGMLKKTGEIREVKTFLFKIDRNALKAGLENFQSKITQARINLQEFKVGIKEVSTVFIGTDQWRDFGFSLGYGTYSEANTKCVLKGGSFPSISNLALETQTLTLLKKFKISQTFLKAFPKDDGIYAYNDYFLGNYGVGIKKENFTHGVVIKRDPTALVPGSASANVSFLCMTPSSPLKLDRNYVQVIKNLLAGILKGLEEANNRVLGAFSLLNPNQKELEWEAKNIRIARVFNLDLSFLTNTLETLLESLVMEEMNFFDDSDLELLNKIYEEINMFLKTVRIRSNNIHLNTLYAKQLLGQIGVSLGEEDQVSNEIELYFGGAQNKETVCKLEFGVYDADSKVSIYNLYPFEKG